MVTNVDEKLRPGRHRRQSLQERREENKNETELVAVEPNLVVGIDLVVVIVVILDFMSSIRHQEREENETKQMVVMPDLVIVMDIRVIRNREATRPG